MDKESDTHRDSGEYTKLNPRRKKNGNSFPFCSAWPYSAIAETAPQTLRRGVACRRDSPWNAQRDRRDIPLCHRRFNGAFGLFSNETPRFHNAKNRVSTARKMRALTNFSERKTSSPQRSTIWLPFFMPFHTTARSLAASGNTVLSQTAWI